VVVTYTFFEQPHVKRTQWDERRDFSEEDVQRGQLGPPGVPGEESPAKMMAQQQKKTP
jgi:hypothetical protein